MVSSGNHNQSQEILKIGSSSEFLNENFKIKTFNFKTFRIETPLNSIKSYNFYNYHKMTLSSSMDLQNSPVEFLNVQKLKLHKLVKLFLGSKFWRP